MSEQSQGVTAGKDEGIEDEIIPSLIRNKGDENRKEDTALKVKINEGIAVELKTPNVTEPNLEAKIEELCLAKEFGVATLQGSGKNSTKYPNSHDTLSNSPQLKKSRDTQAAKALHLDSIRVASTWKC